MPANDNSLSRSITVRGQQVRSAGAPELRTVVMGLVRKAASILTLGGMSSHRRDPKARAAKAQAELAEAETEVAGEQAAAIARAMHEDEEHRQADLEEVAEKEAEAVPWDRSADL
jgi:hypothetical protein